MKLDQLNNFTAEKVNELLASRFGQSIDLSEENLDNLSAFQNAIARELSEVESNIGFNKAMQHPKYVENKLILDLIVKAVEERQVGEDLPAKVKRISGTKVDIEDPDEPGITKTVDTTKTDVDVDDTTGELSLDPQDKDKKETPAQQKIKIGQTVKKDEDINQKEQDSAESYLRYIDELTKELAHDKNSEHFHKDIAHQIQNAVDDLRNNVIGTKPSQARAKFSDQSDQRVVTDPETGKPKWESDEGTGEEGDDIEDMVAPEFEQIIHMLKSGMSPDEIKAKMPDHANTVDQVVNDLAAVTEAMNGMLPEGNVLSGVEQSALRLLVGTKDFMRAKRAIEFAKAGRAIPSDLVAGLKPLFDKIGTFLSAGAGAVKRFGDIEKMIGRTVQKSSTYEEKLVRKMKVKESEIDKAEVALAAKDMVDKIDSMLQDVSQMKGEDLLPLTDKVRDEVGQEASDTLKSSVETSLGELETALQSARSSLDNAARTVAGDPTASADVIGDPMADEPMPTDDLLGAPDELNSLDVPDAEIGGEDPEGRERRESVKPTKTKTEIAEAIFNTLSKRSKKAV